MLVNLNPPTIPEGSLIEAQGAFWPHEMIALGRCPHGREFISHNEPAAGHHLEPLDVARQRYAIRRITVPANEEHAAQVLTRDASLAGSGYLGPVKNCQHDARYSFYGKAESPVASAILLLLLGGTAIYAATR